MTSWLTSQYDKAREEVYRHIPPYWTEAAQVAARWLEDDSLPEIILPIAACKAVGGNPNDAVSVASALLSATIGVRILDDLQDKDKPGALWAEVGQGRAVNFAFAFQTLSFAILAKSGLNSQAGSRVLEEYVEGALVALAGQDRDLLGLNHSWDDYWRTVEMKTAYICSTAAGMGALAGTSSKTLVNACKVFGHHAGFAIQIFNDMDGTWTSNATSDLTQGKVTLPLLYALNCEHPFKHEIHEIVRNKQVSSQHQRIVEILNQIDTKNYLVWAALQQRKMALDAVEICPDKEGVDVLKSYFTGMFGDVGDIMQNNLSQSHEAQVKSPAGTALQPVLET